MSKTPFIVRYKRRDLPGGPLGELIMSDRQTYAVWDKAVHEQCLQLAQIPLLPVTLKTRTSKTGNVYLIAIESAETQEQTYERLRTIDENRPRHHKQGGFVARQISKFTQKHVEDERKDGAL